MAGDLGGGGRANHCPLPISVAFPIARHPRIPLPAHGPRTPSRSPAPHLCLSRCPRSHWHALWVRARAHDPPVGCCVPLTAQSTWCASGNSRTAMWLCPSPSPPPPHPPPAHPPTILTPRPHLPTSAPTLQLGALQAAAAQHPDPHPRQASLSTCSDDSSDDDNGEDDGSSAGTSCTSRSSSSSSSSSTSSSVLDRVGGRRRLSSPLGMTLVAGGCPQPSGLCCVWSGLQVAQVCLGPAFEAPQPPPPPF